MLLLRLGHRDAGLAREAGLRKLPAALSAPVRFAARAFGGTGPPLSLGLRASARVLLGAKHANEKVTERPCLLVPRLRAGEAVVPESALVEGALNAGSDFGDIFMGLFAWVFFFYFQRGRQVDSGL